jgi:putative nucleotidyltransferase with HDIG domain
MYMDSRTRIYILLLGIIAGGFIALHDPWAGLTTFSQDAWEDVFAFAAIGILSQAAAINFGRGGSSSSMAFIPFIACAMLLPPLGSITVAFIVAAFEEIVLAKRPILKRVHNVSQAVLAIGIAAQVYTVLIGTSDRSDVSVMAFIPTVVALFGINILLSSVAISLYRGHQFSNTLFEITGPRGGNIVYDLFASWIAILAVKAYALYTFWGILVMVVSLIVVRHVYFSRRKLEEANHDLLTVLVKAIETRDPYTSGHSIRVSTLAALIAQDLGLPRRRVERVRRAGLLHDIGKIHPEFAAVLQKPHNLTPEERELIQTHAARGADLLQNLSSVDEDIVQAVRHHHERWDGRGYPDGIAGDAIPLYARIIMMCDSIDAMLSDRPYRAALSIAQVERELDNNKGTQFDARLVETVLRENTLHKAVSLVAEWREHVPVESAPDVMQAHLARVARPQIIKRDSRVKVASA